MLSARLGPATPAIQGLQTYALDRMATLFGRQCVRGPNTTAVTSSRTWSIWAQKFNVYNGQRIPRL